MSHIGGGLHDDRPDPGPGPRRAPILPDILFMTLLFFGLVVAFGSGTLVAALLISHFITLAVGIRIGFTGKIREEWNNTFGRWL